MSDNKIKLKYGWQLAERNEWKLLNRLRYDSVTREGEEKSERGRESGKGRWLLCVMNCSVWQLADFVCCKLSFDGCPNK